LLSKAFVCENLSKTSSKSTLVTMSVKKPKSYDEVWAAAEDVMSDALRKLDAGISRARYMATYT
jgi:hypothetical protein